jgi:hypothetical protein
MPTYNPLLKVRPKPTTDDPNPTWITNIPAPSKYDWSINDVSSAETGRTEDGKMQKIRVARKRKLELEWQNRSMDIINTVLAAFSPNYVEVNFLDPLENGYTTKTFYSGDQAAPSYNVRLNIWTLRFNIIEQ